MPSFDVVCRTDLMEVANAIANGEVEFTVNKNKTM